MNVASDQSVEIAIPVYQDGLGLERSIISVLNQQYPNFRLRIVDDGSDDDVLDLARKYAETDKRIHVYTNGRRGASFQRNFVLKTFQSNWLIWLDNGDVLDADFISKRLQYLAEEGYTFEDPVAVVGYVRHSDDNGHIGPMEPGMEWIDGDHTLNNLLTFSIQSAVALHYGGTLSKGAIKKIMSAEPDLYPNEMFNGPDYIATTRMVAAGISFLRHSDTMATIISNPYTGEEGEVTNKFIARFKNFCRGAAYHKPYFKGDDQFMKNALSCHFLRRSRVLENMDSSDPRKTEYAEKARANAFKYNPHVESLLDLVEIAPTLTDRVNLLKSFDCGTSAHTYVNFMGVDIALHKDVRICRRLLTHGEYEDSKIFRMIHFIKKFKIEYFFDIGASVGIYSAVLGKKCQKVRRIFAFEPTPIHFDLLKLTMERFSNIYKNNGSVEIYPLAVGDGVTSKENLLVSRSFGGANRLLHTIPEEQMSNTKGMNLPDIHGDGTTVSFDNIVEVGSISLDSRFLFAGERIAMKIDCEGSELSVMDGAKKLLLNNWCFLQVESCPRLKNDLFHSLLSLGYKHISSEGRDHYFSNFLF